MRQKYKKFLKAAYINYDEDYCGSGSGVFTKPTVATPIIVITDTTAIIACATSGATIYYTLDGSTPTNSSTAYTGTITLTQSCTIKAIAVKPGMSDSGVAEESYVKPITYLTQWKIVGNSEVHGTEIWSCGEYNATDGKYHILVQPQGGSIADIALPAPLKKVNDVAETIIYPYSSSVSNAAIVSVFFISVSTDKLIADRIVTDRTTGLPIYCKTTFTYSNTGKGYSNSIQANILCNKIKNVLSIRDAPNHNGEFIMVSGRSICVRNTAIEQTVEAYQSYFDSLGAIEIIWPVNTPGTGGVKVSQIQEADSYSMIISQGGKAVEWSSFTTE